MSTAGESRFRSWKPNNTARVGQPVWLAPGQSDPSRRVDPYAARLASAAVILLSTAAGLLGLLGIGLAMAGFPIVRRAADLLAPDGSMERFTPDLYLRLIPLSWAAGVTFALLAGAMFLSRVALERQLLESVTDALVPEQRTASPAPADRPVLLAAAATALAFWVLYLWLGVALWSTGVFDHFDGIFSADPPRVIRDLAAAGADGGRSHLHPLFVLFLNPIGAPLARLLGWHTLAALVLTSFAGAASVFLGQLFFHNIGMPARLAVLWSIVLGATASHLVFSATPETGIYAAPPTIACCMLAHRRLRFAPYVASSLAAFSVTSTNVATVALIYLCSLRRPFAARVLRTAMMVAVVLAAAVPLALIQKTVYTHSKLFFVPAEYRSAVFEFMPDLRESIDILRRTDDMAWHLFVFTMMAPEPYLKQPKIYLGAGTPPAHGFRCPQVCAEVHLADERVRPPDSHPSEITFEGPGAISMQAVGWVGAILWLGLLVLGLHDVARHRRRSRRLLSGIMAALAFQFVLHLVYGDDLFLYSPHWAFLLVAGVALMLRRHWHRRWLMAAAAALVVIAALNNGTFAYNLWAVFSRQHM